MLVLRACWFFGGAVFFRVAGACCHDVARVKLGTALGRDTRVCARHARTLDTFFADNGLQRKHDGRIVCVVALVFDRPKLGIVWQELNWEPLFDEIL